MRLRVGTDGTARNPSWGTISGWHFPYREIALSDRQPLINPRTTNESTSGRAYCLPLALRKSEIAARWSRNNANSWDRSSDPSVRTGHALLIEWLRAARQGGREIRFANVPAQIEALARISEVEDLIGGEKKESEKRAAPMKKSG
jgi:ABC-type transporter Mla MlaB component